MHSTRASGIVKPLIFEIANKTFESALGVLEKCAHHSTKKPCSCLKKFIQSYETLQELKSDPGIHQYFYSTKLKSIHFKIRKTFHQSPKKISIHQQLQILFGKSHSQTHHQLLALFAPKNYPAFSSSECASSTSLNTSTSSSSHSENEISPRQSEEISTDLQLSHANAQDALNPSEKKSKSYWRRFKKWLNQTPENSSSHFKNDTKDVRTRNGLFKSIKDWFGVETNGGKLFLKQVEQHSHASAGIQAFLSPNSIAMITAIANSLNFLKLGLAVIADLLTFASATMLGTRAMWIRMIEGGTKLIGLTLRIVSFVFGLIPVLKPISYIIDLSRSILGNLTDGRRVFSCFTEYFRTTRALSLLASEKSHPFSLETKKALKKLEIKYDENHPNIKEIQTALEKKKRECRTDCINNVHDYIVGLLYVTSAILCVIPGLLPAGLLMGTLVGYYDTADKGGFNPFKQIGKLIFGNVFSNKEKDYSALSPKEKIEREEKELKKRDKYWNRILICALFITAATLLTLIPFLHAGYFLILPFILFTAPTITLWCLDRFGDIRLTTTIRESFQSFKKYCEKNITKKFNQAFYYLQDKAVIAINYLIKKVTPLIQSIRLLSTSIFSYFEKEKRRGETMAPESGAKMRDVNKNSASSPPQKNLLRNKNQPPNKIKKMQPSSQIHQKIATASPFSNSSSAASPNDKPHVETLHASQRRPAACTRDLLHPTPSSSEKISYAINTHSIKAGILFTNQPETKKSGTQPSIKKSSPSVLQSLFTSTSNAENKKRTENHFNQNQTPMSPPINIPQNKNPDFPSKSSNTPAQSHSFPIFNKNKISQPKNIIDPTPSKNSPSVS